MMGDINKLHEELMQRPEYRAEYEATREAFALQRELIRIRQEAHLTQSELASRMGTRQSNISRIESGSCNPDLSTLRAYAQSCGKTLKIEFV